MIRAILAKIGKKIDGNWQMEHISAYTYISILMSRCNKILQDMYRIQIPFPFVI